MHTDPTRPVTKANSTKRRGWSHYGLALAVLCLLAVPVVAQSCANSSCMNPPFNLSAYYGGQNITINQCIDPNSSSCAWADAVNASSTDASTQYFLACSLTPNPIALCYYSGKPGLPDNTPSCTLSQNGNAAQCNCYEISSNNAPGGYSYVEITAILNQNIYNAVVSECVDATTGDITKCLTYADVLNKTMNPPPQSTTLCTALTSQPNGLFPGADLISDFYDVGIKGSLGIPPPVSPGAPCPPAGGSNPYAACMTAPCKHTNKKDPKTGLSLASCTCPTFDGPNQVGNPQIGKPTTNAQCSPTPYVWSSANTVINSTK